MKIQYLKNLKNHHINQYFLDEKTCYKFAPINEAEENNVASCFCQTTLIKYYRIDIIFWENTYLAYMMIYLIVNI